MNNKLEEFAITHLCNLLYHLHLISKLFFPSLTFNKYPGVHINKNAKGIDNITFQGAIPMLVARLYLIYMLQIANPIKYKENNPNNKNKIITNVLLAR